jgi:hypothetical protein
LDISLPKVAPKISQTLSSYRFFFAFGVDFLGF